MVEQNAPRDTPNTQHHTESFLESFVTAEWGFQCFTCGFESVGYETLPGAESAADQHVADQGGV